MGLGQRFACIAAAAASGRHAAALMAPDALAGLPPASALPLFTAGMPSAGQAAARVFAVVELAAALALVLLCQPREAALAASAVLVGMHLLLFMTVSALDPDQAADFAPQVAESAVIQVLAGLALFASWGRSAGSALPDVAARELLQSPQKERNRGPPRRKPSRQSLLQRTSSN